MAEALGASLMVGGVVCAFIAVTQELRGPVPFERRMDRPRTWMLAAGVLLVAGAALIAMA